MSVMTDLKPRRIVRAFIGDPFLVLRRGFSSEKHVPKRVFVGRISDRTDRSTTITSNRPNSKETSDTWQEGYR